MRLGGGEETYSTFPPKGSQGALSSRKGEEKKEKSKGPVKENQEEGGVEDWWPGPIMWGTIKGVLCLKPGVRENLEVKTVQRLSNTSCGRSTGGELIPRKWRDLEEGFERKVYGKEMTKRAAGKRRRHNIQGI